MKSFVEFEPYFEKRIAEWLARKPTVDWLGTVAQIGLLPLLPDWSGCLALCRDGVVVFVDEDPPHRFQPVQVERIRNMALFKGSQRYPELQPWVPQKPADGRACSHCHGTGNLVLPDFPQDKLHMLACYCGGLGWLPSSDPG